MNNITMPLIAELMGWGFDSDTGELSKLLNNGNTIHANMSVRPIPASELQGIEDVFLDMITEQIMLCMKVEEDKALKKHLGEPDWA